MNETKKPNPAADALATLAASFPVFRDGQPLAIGIHKVLKQRLPDLKDADLRLALRRHVSSTKYLKAVANGSSRFDLDGNPAGEITAEHRNDALASLKERFRKAAERKREEQQEKERQEKEKERLDKLHKLAEKFGRK
jgi:ProP effector